MVQILRVLGVNIMVKCKSGKGFQISSFVFKLLPFERLKTPSGGSQIPGQKCTTWWQRHKHGDSLNDKQRLGRPSCLSSRAKDLIFKAKGKRNQSCCRLSQRLKTLEKVFLMTLHRHLTTKLGFQAYKNINFHD